MSYVNVKLSLDDLYCLLGALALESDDAQSSELMTRLEREKDRCTYHPDEEIKR